MKKVFIAFLLAILPISFLQASAFSDIQNSEFKPYIDQMVAEKLVSGYDDGLFRPSNPVSFAESLKIATNITHGAQDIPSGKNWADFYEEKYKKDFFQNEKTFGQSQKISRDFAMYIILRNLGINLENKKIPNQFGDVKESSIFANYINFAKMNGIVNGYSNGQFGPNNLVTRGEFSKMAWKSIRKNREKILQSYKNLDEIQKGKITWENCSLAKFNSFWQSDYEKIPETLKAMKCAWHEVPLDYNNPNGPKVSLALTLREAKNTENLGYLIMIAGGPGENGLPIPELLLENEKMQKLREKFHIISYAPRGVFPSTPAVNCGQFHTDKNVENFLKDCYKNTDAMLLKNLSTKQAFEDVESIRKGIKAEKITVMAFSAGTRVLAGYAHKYGNHLRAGLFDGVMDISHDLFSSIKVQKQGMEQIFEKFAKYCVAHQDCIFTNADTMARDLAAFMKESAKFDHPAYAEDDVMLTFIYSLYNTTDWERSISLFKEMYDGKYPNGNFSRNLTDQKYFFDNIRESLKKQGVPEAQIEERIKALQSRNKQKPRVALLDNIQLMTCADLALPHFQRDRASYIAKMKEVNSAFSLVRHYGLSDEEMTMCLDFPYVGQFSSQQLQPHKNAPQMLFVSFDLDLATPSSSAQSMAKMFQSPLLIQKGNGHIVTGKPDKDCANQKIINYLLNPSQKLENMTCQ